MDDLTARIVALSHGDPGATHVAVSLYLLEGAEIFAILEKRGLTGVRLWKFHNDICEGDIARTCAAILRLKED